MHLLKASVMKGSGRGSSAHSLPVCYFPLQLREEAAASSEGVSPTKVLPQFREHHIHLQLLSYRRQSSRLCLGNRGTGPSSAGELNPVCSWSIAGGVCWQPDNALVNPCVGTSGQFDGIRFSLPLTWTVTKPMDTLVKHKPLQKAT